MTLKKLERKMYKASRVHLSLQGASNSILNSLWIQITNHNKVWLGIGKSLMFPLDRTFVSLLTLIHVEKTKGIRRMN
jgi:hypothetical protein